MFSLTGLPPGVRRAFKWDALSALIGGLSSGALYPFLGVILRRDLHASPYLIALLGTAFSVGNLFNPLMAHSMRNRAKLPYAVWPPIIGRTLFLLMPLARAAPTFVGITVLGSAFGSLAAPAYAAVIRDAYPVERRGRLMGFVRVLSVGASMIGALCGGVALRYISYRWFFPAAALVGVAGVCAFSRIGVPAAPDQPAPSDARMLDAFRIVAADRIFGLYSMAFFFHALGNLILSPVFPVFQVDLLHISNQWVAYLSTAASGMGMVGYLCWGRVLDRRGPFRLLLFVLLVASIGPITYYFAHSVPVLLIAAAAQGLAMAGGDLGYVNASMRFAPRQLVVSYAAVFAFLQSMRGIPGPFIGAALSQWIGPRSVFLVTLALWVAAATVASVGARAARDREQAAR
ncbi:MAG: MFS transporter [Armatimonadota bacterium]